MTHREEATPNYKSNGTLESAGRRMTLFNRLIEEYSIANLNGKTKEEQQQTQALHPAK